MLNEGIISNSPKTLVKSEMLRQLWANKRTTPDLWERAVFKALTGSIRDQVDWDFDDNQAGYYTWLKSFDQLVQELIEDGYVREEAEGGGKVLVATEVDPGLDLSMFAYPTR